MDIPLVILILPRSMKRARRWRIRPKMVVVTDLPPRWLDNPPGVGSDWDYPQITQIFADKKGNWDCHNPHFFDKSAYICEICG